MLPAFLASIWARLYELDLNHNTIVEDNAELEIINNKLDLKIKLQRYKTSEVVCKALLDAISPKGQLLTQ